MSAFGLHQSPSESSFFQNGQLTLSIPSSSIFFTFMLSVDIFLAYVVNTSIGIALSNGDGGIYERNEGES